MDESSYLDTSTVPTDKNYFVLFVCSMLGLCVLFPWNALITANNFWEYSFPDTNYVTYLSAAYNYPQWIMLLVVTKYGPKFSFQSRIITTLIIYAFNLIAIPVVCALPVNMTFRLVCSLLLDFLTGVSASIQFGTILGLVAVFPSKYMTAAMSGMVIGGVLIGVLAIIFQAATSDLENGALVQAGVYFSSAVVVVLTTLVLYLLMNKTAFAEFYISKYHMEVNKFVGIQEAGEAPTAKGFSWYMQIFNKMAPDALSVFLVFFVTLSLFPGIMLMVTPDYISQTYYYLVIPLEFNIFDTIGRSLPYLFVIPNKFVWPLVIARVVFYPLVIFCVNPVLFPSPELWMYAFNAIFATSNGFLGTLCMIYGPQKVEADQQQTAGIMMSFFLNFGIFCATNFALFISYVVNPS